MRSKGGLIGIGRVVGRCEGSFMERRAKGGIRKV